MSGRRLTLVLVFFIFLISCDRAKLSLVNPNGKSGDVPGKAGCGKDISTIGVFDVNENLIGSMTSWSGELSAEENYNYVIDEFGIPVHGPLSSSGTLTAFTYENTQGTYLFFTFDNYDEQRAKSFAKIKVKVGGNRCRDNVVVSDDIGELLRADIQGDDKEDLCQKNLNDDKNVLATVYQGKFNYQIFPDGGVIGPLIGNEWVAEFEFKESTSIYQIFFADTLAGGTRTQMLSASQRFIFRPMNLKFCELPGKN